MREIKLRPLSAWKFDANLTDYTGLGNTATLSAAQISAPSLVRSSTYSTVLRSACTATLPNQKIFIKNEESHSFSISAYVSSVVVDTASTAPVAIVTPTTPAAATMTGLTVTKERVDFIVRFAEGNVTCSYSLPEPRKFHVVGVYTRAAIELYIDGEHVASTAIPETWTLFVENGGTLYSGLTTGNNKILVNNIATYGKALNQEQIKFIYERETFSPDISDEYLGERFDLSLDNRNVVYYHEFDSTEDWNLGVSRNIRIYDNILGTTNAGQWKFVTNLDYGTVNYIALDWDALNVTVETSFDGVTWTAATRNVHIVTGYNTTGKSLNIRVNFPNETAELNYLSVAIVSNDLNSGYNERTLTFGGNPVSVSKDNILDFPFDNGTLFKDTGDSVAFGNYLSDDGSGNMVTTPYSTRTIEFWAKGNITLTGTTGTETRYYNGGLSTVDTDAWTLHHVTYSAANNNFTLQAGASGAAIADVVVYPNVLTTGQMLDIYKRYMGLMVLSVLDATPIAVSETAGGPVIYQNVWTISQSG